MKNCLKNFRKAKNQHDQKEMGKVNEKNFEFCKQNTQQRRQ